MTTFSHRVVLPPGPMTKPRASLVHQPASSLATLPRSPASNTAQARCAFTKFRLHQQPEESGRNRKVFHLLWIKHLGNYTHGIKSHSDCEVKLSEKAMRTNPQILNASQFVTGKAQGKRPGLGTAGRQLSSLAPYLPLQQELSWAAGFLNPIPAHTKERSHSFAY